MNAKNSRRTTVRAAARKTPARRANAQQAPIQQATTQQAPVQPAPTQQAGAQQLSAQQESAQKTLAQQESAESALIAFLRVHRRIRGVAIAVLAILFAIVLTAMCTLCWFMWLPSLWHWGFDTASWRVLPGIFCVFWVVVFPFVPVAMAADLAADILRMYAAEADDRVRVQIEAAMVGQDELERDLQEKDKYGLIKLVRYSRIQLQAYYGIGLSQTQRSFRYSVIAMWLGFGIIVTGIASYVVPIRLDQSQQSASAQQFVLMSGAIIELISTVFLWVYKSSLNQLTYFYDRQFYNHNALLSFSIAESMTDKDVAKTKIVEHLLSQTLLPEKRVVGDKKGGGLKPTG